MCRPFVLSLTQRPLEFKLHPQKYEGNYHIAESLVTVGRKDSFVDAGHAFENNSKYSGVPLDSSCFVRQLAKRFAIARATKVW